MYAFRRYKGESGNRVSPILLPGIDGLSFRYFLDRVFFFLFLFLKIELSAGESTVHEIFRKVERSGFMEGKFCCEYFVATYEIFARVT